MTRQRILAILMLVALLTSACARSAEQRVDAESTATNEVDLTVDGEIEGEAPSPLPQTNEPLVTSETTAEPTETTAAPATDPQPISQPECTAPESEERFVDVAVDDPDGGLNVRTEAGIDSGVIFVLERGAAIVTLGTCATIGTTEWWEVSAGTETGWVSSNFLSEALVFSPGVGTIVLPRNQDLVGLSAPTLDELVAEVANELGFEDDVVIAETVAFEGIDAIGGNASYELTGLRDDSVNGFLVDMNIMFDRSADGSELLGFSTLSVDVFPLCTRGVSDEGLCI